MLWNWNAGLCAIVFVCMSTSANAEDEMMLI